MRVNLYVDFPDFSYSNKPALTIYFSECNMSCKWCNFKKMLQIKNLKEMSLNRLIKLLKNYKQFYDIVIISGGEPSLYEQEVEQIVKLSKQLNKEVYVYTNLLNWINIMKSDEYIDKYYVDVKGFTPNEIAYNTKINKRLAEQLYQTYLKFRKNNKIVFRINNQLNKANEINFKNKEYYNVEVI